MKSYCIKCRNLVESKYEQVGNTINLVKECPTCGITFVCIETDAVFFEEAEALPRTYAQNDCYVTDVTTVCTAGCRNCFNRSPDGGKHRTVEDVMNEISCAPSHSRIILSGGEPLESPWIRQIINGARVAGYGPCLLTNGARLTRAALDDLITCGLLVVDGIPQVAVSLQLPHYNNTHAQALENLKKICVTTISFTVESLADIPQILALATDLKGHYKGIALRCAWNGETPSIFTSEIIQALKGNLVQESTLYGYMFCKVESQGILFEVINWPTWPQWVDQRYKGRGIWYYGDNFATTLVNRYMATSPMAHD